ncbi:MAG: CRISPR-associated helicase Cas3' [Dictyoglomaceae bacterium]|nr:CRISPR-associated helicase Cas3' [Dictyoglomaceae bacterium]
MTPEILAKSHKKEKITLFKHTSDVLLAFEKLKKIIKFNEKLEESIKLAIFLHDLGKSLPVFQIKTLRNNNYEPFDVSYEIPHSLFSIFWIDKNKLKSVLGEDYFEYVISAIAYHHWRDNFDVFIAHKNETLISLCDKVLRDWKECIKNNLLNELAKFENYVNYININESWLKGIKNGRALMFYVKPPYKFDYEPIRGTFQKDWILISGFLQRCDHFASWCEEEGESLDQIEISIKNIEEVKNKITDKISKDAWQFQILEETNNKNIILVAPTGYGKTEFAFLWGNGQKIIYTLPLRSAVNQLFEERAMKLFGEDKVGLLHSDADVFTLEKEIEIESIKPYELARQISFPVIISTGDQFFPYALRPPGYEKIFALFPYSKFVIDEIQAYNPKACAIITKFIEWLIKLDGNFLLMTATLPKFVRDKLIRDETTNFSYINIYEKEKKNLANVYKHNIKLKIIEKKEKTKYLLPEEELNKIIQLAEEDKRVLVILNSIELAQWVYEKLKDKASYTSLKDKVYLLHSKFTITDRREKEKLYTEEFKNPKPPSESEGKILVATQVIEVSLDIDADFLFTEICPLDALIQRMGRVLRRYYYRDGKLINKSNSQEIDLRNGTIISKDANIYVWIFSEKPHHSGGSWVYSNEQIKTSLFALFISIDKKKMKDLYNQITNFDFFGDNYDEELENLLQKEISSMQEIGKSEKSIYNEILENEEQFKKILNLLQNKEIILSEYDKYILVDLFYSLFKRKSKYLRDYFETTSLLDEGWMSEKRLEAQRLFREIYSVMIVPSNMHDSFLRSLKDFIENEENFNYLSFKRKIVSQYCINVDLRKYFDNSILKLRPISEKIYEIEISKNQDRVYKIISWLREIFYHPNLKYDEERGLLD